MKKNTSLTEEYIFEAFHKLLEQKQYSKITVCDICEKAGVSRMSFYRNFKDKEDLIKKGLEHVISETEKHIESLEVVNQYTITKEFFETFKLYKNVLSSINETKIIETLMACLISSIKQYSNKLDAINKTSKYIPTFFFSGVFVTIYEWLKGGAVESTDEMARFIVSITSNNVFNQNLPKPSEKIKNLK